MNSTSQPGIEFYYHEDSKHGMSKKAAEYYKKLSASSARDKDICEKLSWDNLYSSLLTKHEEALETILLSPDYEFDRRTISSMIGRLAERGKMYFDLKDDKESTDKNDYSANTVLRFYLCNSNHHLVPMTCNHF